MKTKNKDLLLVFLLILMLLLVGGYQVYQNIKAKSINDVKTIDDIDTSIDIDNGEEKVNWEDLEEKKITTSSDITISEEGIYNLSGTIEGPVIVNTKGNVKLVLDNVTITSQKGPAIIIEKSNNTVIYLADNTTNVLEDASNYSYDDSDINGVIYSKDDLIFDGLGTLKIKANYQDGIVSKDDLKIISGNFIIDSVDDGIRGKDSVYIQNGNFTITSGGDAIKSTNDTDDQKGYIKIDDGTFDIVADLDGIQAETKLLITSGNFNIKTGGGSSNSSKNDNWGNWGRYQNITSDTSSSKGLKAGSNIVIEMATFNLDTSDDSIHSNNYIGIKSGTYQISSGDDGIHADTEIIIDGGNIDIEESYEGIEAAKITINDGNINVVASDDGINIAGGNDSSSMNRPGKNNYNENTTNTLTVNGGKIYVNASGDGIDINGSGYIYGGNIIVDGPTDNGNGALDYDNKLVVNGGSLIAAGSSGMHQSVSTDSTQYNVTIYFNSTYNNKKITIIDSNGNVIIEHTPAKSYQAVTISSSNFKNNETYTVKVDNTAYKEFTISSISTTIGSGNNMNNDKNPGSRPNDKNQRYENDTPPEPR